MTKNNGVELTGVAIIRQENSVFPTIYLEGLYEEYLRGESIDDLAGRIINCHEEQSMALDLDMDFFHDYGSVKNRIFYKLVSFAENKKFWRMRPIFAGMIWPLYFIMLWRTRCLRERPLPSTGSI